MSKHIKNNAKLWAIAAAAAVLVIGLAAYRWVNSAQHSNTLKIRMPRLAVNVPV